MKKNRNGKPTAFQVAAIKKAGLPLKGIKTYRDAENALRRAQRAEKAKGPKKPVSAPAKPAPEKKAEKVKPQTAAKKPTKKVAGVGVFRVKIAKADILEALLVGLAKSILAVLAAK